MSTTTNTALDAIAFSALLSSRLCHDLINPVGALGAGLEMLNDPTSDDDLRKDAIALVCESAEKSIALLKYGRLAYGAAGGFAAVISLEEARDALVGVYAPTKATLHWGLPLGHAPKSQVKAILILGYAAADFVARGGTVEIAGAPDDFTVTARGDRVFFSDEFACALAGETADMKPKFAPAYLVGLMARETGGAASVRADASVVELAARIPAENLEASAFPLTAG